MGTVRKSLRIYADVCGGTLGRMSGPFSVVCLAIGLFTPFGEKHEEAQILFFGLAYVSLFTFAVSTAIKNYTITHKASEKLAMLSEIGKLHQELAARLAQIKANGFLKYRGVATSGYNGTADAQTSAILD